MSEFHLTVSQEQHDLLVRLLSAALTKKRVEVHRTEFSRDYRHELEAEEVQIQAILEKLSPAAV